MIGIFSRPATMRNRSVWGPLPSRVAMAAAIVSPWPLAAQTVQPLPAIQQQIPTREEVTNPAVERAPRRGSTLTIKNETQRAPCALAAPEFAQVKITFGGAVFHDLRGLPAEALRPAYQDLIGKTLPIAVVCEIRDSAATILRKAGYLAAVQVPPQNIENGIVHFDVLMPKLVGITVRGKVGHSGDLIAAYFSKLVGPEVFNQIEAERYLLLVRDLPGYDVRLTLRPAGTGVAGEVIGEISVLRRSYAVDFNVQNYGSRSVGRWAGLLHGEAYDILGRGDRASVGLFSTADLSEQTVLQTGYDVRLGAEGLTAATNFTYAWTHPSLDAGLDVRSRTLVAGASLRYPFLRAQNRNVSGTAGFDLVDQTVRFNDLPLSRDHIRAAYVRMTADATDADSVTGQNGFSEAEPRWRIGTLWELRQDIGVFGATTPCQARQTCGGTSGTPSSRLDGSPRGTILRQSAQVEWRPVPRIAFVATEQAQYSPSRLLQFDQMSGGTYTIGRGYDAGTIQGDKGVGVGLELRYGNAQPQSTTDLTIQPFGFFDIAWTGRNGSPDGFERKSRLSSAGGGMRAVFGAYGRLEFTIARPLERAGPLDRRGTTRALLSLSTRLLPWQR